MSDPLSPIISVAPETIATATLVVETGGQAFTDITREAMRFIKQTGAKDGALFMFMRHTSASLVIQENADPDVRTDLVNALDRLAPADAPGFMMSRGLTTCRRMSRPCSPGCRSTSR